MAGRRTDKTLAKSRSRVSKNIGDLIYSIWRKEVSLILRLQPRDKAAMLVVTDTKEIFLQNLHQNRVHFPAERNSFVFDHQHGCRDITCKPAIALSKSFKRGNRSNWTLWSVDFIKIFILILLLSFYFPNVSL